VAGCGKVSSGAGTGATGSAEAIGAPHPRQKPSISRDEEPHWLQNTTLLDSVRAQSLLQIQVWVGINAWGVPGGRDIFDTLLRL